MNPKPEIQFFPERCIHCGACFEQCPNGAHIEREGEHLFERSRCEGCGQCADTCYAGALVLVGQTRTVEEVVDEVLQDRAFYTSSGGGITLSGGEPLLQRDFAYAVLDRCRQAGIHTAIETAANFPWQRVASILPVTDLVMMDIKLIDSARHRCYTGAPNEKILANVERLGRQSQPLIIRTPIIPGVNDSPVEVQAIAAFIARLPNLLYYELLPYHPMAKSKYLSLEQTYQAADLTPPSKEKMAALVEAARAEGITVRSG